MQTDSKRGLGEAEPPTAQPSNNFTFQVQLLLRSHHVYATSIKILNVHTHQYLYFVNFENIKPYMVIRFQVLFVYIEIMRREQWVGCMISFFDIDKEEVPSLYYTSFPVHIMHGICIFVCFYLPVHIMRGIFTFVCF